MAPALYFSRPVNRFDYAAMKFLSVTLILLFIINGTLAVYYFVDILVMGKGWAWIIDAFRVPRCICLWNYLVIYLYLNRTSTLEYIEEDSSQRLD